MAASKQNPSPDDEDVPGPRRWTEPDPAAVAEQIDLYLSMDNGELTEAIAAFVLAGTIGSRTRRPEDYELQAYAIRSPELARKAMRLLASAAREPDVYVPGPEGESQNARVSRINRFRSRADKEEQFLHAVLAGDAARRGYFLADSNPRGRARRRLADEYPERFLALIKEEEAEDTRRKAAAAAEKKKLKAEAKRAAREAAAGR
ncbi:hypothetical protein ABT024_05355 [Streptomyces sp. NPDC002812]|uniref:hypothetical protein n=1 Tax=Streptomyces sp. NPDC002812 TaxID=3154434 RepID=UPI003320BA67